MSTSKSDIIKIQSFLLKEVFAKLEYDPIEKQYIVTKDIYAPLNLTKRVMRELEKMCEESGIVLERFSKRLSPRETEELFKKQSSLKKQLALNPNDETIKEKLIQVRNEIAIGYMDLVYKFISRKVPDIEKRSDKEDIYQIGYELLLEFIDVYNVEKKPYFDVYIRYYLLQHVMERVVRVNHGLHKDEARNLNRVVMIKKKMSISDHDEMVEKIAVQTGLKRKYVEYLLVLEKAIEKISIENLNKDLNDSILRTLPTIEEKIVEDIIKNNIHKLLSLLTPIQKEVIMLYYGFIDGTTYSQQQIADKLKNISSERVRQIKEDALAILSIPICKAHIGVKDYNLDELDEYLTSKKLPSENKRNEEIELFLLQSLPNEVLEEVLSILSQEEKEVILLSSGLKNGEKYNQSEIAKRLYTYPDKVQKLKIESLEKIRRFISRKNNIPNNKSIYLNFLMEQYLKNTRPNKKKH